MQVSGVLHWSIGSFAQAIDIDFKSDTLLKHPQLYKHWNQICMRIWKVLTRSALHASLSPGFSWLGPVDLLHFALFVNSKKGQSLVEKQTQCRHRKTSEFRTKTIFPEPVRKCSWQERNGARFVCKYSSLSSVTRNLEFCLFSKLQLKRLFGQQKMWIRIVKVPKYQEQKENLWEQIAENEKATKKVSKAILVTEETERDSEDSTPGFSVLFEFS